MPQPPPDPRAAAETALPHLWLPYTQMRGLVPPLRAARTAGAHIVLEDGRRLVDAVSSWWTACHGHAHPHIVEAMERQLRDMPHVMFGGLVHAPAERLAARLADLLPGTLRHAFFSDSGSVAVEVAMKMAVQFWINHGERGRTEFVFFRHGYHGDTMAAMSVTDPEEGMHRLFRGYLPEQAMAELPRDGAGQEALRAKLRERQGRVAAVIVEPLVQCAGGMKMHDPPVLRAIADAAREADVLLVVDEIATGFGRTGSMFAIEQAGVCPDILCLGKALTGGAVSLAATVASGEVFEAFLDADESAALMHGPTYMANPLACAAANASLDLFEREPRLEQVAAIERHLAAALLPLGDVAGVVDVRIKGAVGAIEVAELHSLDRLKGAFVDAGVWLRPFGNVIYTMPPFTLTDPELAAITDAMTRIVPVWADGAL